ncbi:unnamed protein product [Hermetia illucens]|uniref:Uncharacterized protein n=1 Tax=Hermetia illucens TaxID=343691 RepID=A0A7R8YLS4_HERIL|nr:unnamed protein product [Hermetia illucens]
MKYGGCFLWEYVNALIFRRIDFMIPSKSTVEYWSTSRNLLLLQSILIFEIGTHLKTAKYRGVIEEIYRAAYGILYQKPLTPFVMEMKAIC